MRRPFLAAVALSALAACSDSITAPAPAAPPNAAMHTAAAAGAGALAVLPAQTIAWNEGGLFYGQNLPLPDVGGGRIVWQDASSGNTEVLAYDVATGARTRYGAVDGNFAYPAAAGRYTVWSSQAGTLYLRDGATGQVREIGTGAGYTARVSAEGRVAYVEYGAGVGNVAVYDAATGATRILTHYTSGGGVAASEVDIDGGLVAWSIYTLHSPYTAGIRMMELGAGVERVVVDVPQQSIGTPSVSDGRIVWSDGRSGNQDVYLFDAASGDTRQVTTDPHGQFNARISGDYVVWEDTRNSTSPYFPSNDIYVYDVATGRELPVATGENHQGWPRIDGDRVIWTERANDRWEIRTATLERVTLQSLGATVDGMLASGEIRDRGTAESLRAFLAQAGRGDTGALQRFADQAQRLSGNQVSAAAAARLVALADALMRG